MMRFKIFECPKISDHNSQVIKVTLSKLLKGFLALPELIIKISQLCYQILFIA